MNEMWPEKTTATKTTSPLMWVGYGVLAFVFIIGVTLYFLTRPPNNFTSTTVEITSGQSAADIAAFIKDQNIVRSSALLYAVLVIDHDPSQLKAGVYSFETPESLFVVADILAATTPQEQQYTVTFPEGFTHYEFNTLVPERFKATTTEAFLPYEGYLFPDTYFIPASFSADDVVNVLRTTFDEKIQTLTPEIARSNFSEKEVIILASILEREANDPVSRRLVSGILQNRLEIGMALQVDASVAYGLGISGTELTRDDIETDTPFNTYTRTGLPPTPIANPGLEAIRAVLEPTSSDYLFYITGNDGNFYYAETLAEHTENIARYLK